MNNELPTPAMLRKFAADAGIQIGARGRIPRLVIEAFQKAYKKAPKKYAKYLVAA